MLTSSQLAVLAPPPGFLWSGNVKPSLRVSGRLVRDSGQTFSSSTASKRLLELYEWAIKNSLGVVPTGHAFVDVNYYDVYVVAEFKVTANKVSITKEHFGEFLCPNANCGANVTVGSLTCPACRRTVRCVGCERTGIKLYKVDSVASPTQANLCATCAPTCLTVGCSKRVWKGGYGSAFTGLCSTCSPVIACISCSRYSPKAEAKEVNYKNALRKVCKACYDKYCCPVCESFKRTALTDLEGKKMCKPCASVALDKTRVKYEAFDFDELPKGGKLLIENLPERPYRVVSIETEVDGDKDILAGTLYRCGIVKAPEVESYGSQIDPSSKWICHLKHDGSVTGGELISYLMNLDTEAHADAFMDVLKKLRSLQKLGKIAYNSNCGGHIHIDAHNFGYGDVWRLLTIWNYVEDVIYRLAGAGASYSHRSLDPRHDRANYGGGYANSPVKGPFGTKGEMGVSVRAQHRMSGLNFRPYLESIGGCRCRAFADNGDGRNCSCNLGKATIEWRVWNSTGNPRILHAWIALMQAMHAYADQGIDPDAEWEKQFKTFPYVKAKFSTLGADHSATTKERLEWMFANLILTDNEKDSLIYTIKQSELTALGTEWIESLRKVEPVGGWPRKAAPRNPAKRPNPITIEPIKGETKLPVSTNTLYQALARDQARVIWNNVVPNPFPAGRF